MKVYTVGPRYAHAEARKSPVVDGKVTRSADGKELRFPVLLSPQARHASSSSLVCPLFSLSLHADRCCIPAPAHVLAVGAALVYMQAISLEVLCVWL